MPKLCRVRPVFPPSIFGKIGLNHQIIRKSRMPPLYLSDNRLAAPGPFFPDYRNASSCNIRLLIFTLPGPADLFVDVRRADLPCFFTLGALREASPSPQGNPRNRPGDKQFAPLRRRLRHSTRPHQSLKSTAKPEFSLFLASSPCQFTVGRTNRKDRILYARIRTCQALPGNKLLKAKKNEKRIFSLMGTFGRPFAAHGNPSGPTPSGCRIMRDCQTHICYAGPDGCRIRQLPDIRWESPVREIREDLNERDK